MTQVLTDLTHEIESLEQKRSQLQELIDVDLKTVSSDQLSKTVQSRQSALAEVSNIDTILVEMKTRLNELEFAQKREHLEAEKQNLQIAAEKFQKSLTGWSKKLSIGRQYLELLREFATEAERAHGVNYRLAAIDQQLNHPELQEMPVAGYVAPAVQLDLKIGRYQKTPVPLLEQEGDSWVLRLRQVREGQADQ